MRTKSGADPVPARKAQIASHFLRSIFMCACLLRARGKDFDVGGFLRDSPWREYAQFTLKGTQARPHTAPRDYSWLCLDVEKNDHASVSEQIKACRDLIRKDRAEFDRLAGFAGVDQKWFSLSYYLPLGEVLAIGPHFDRGFLSDLHAVGFEFDFNVFLCQRG